MLVLLNITPSDEMKQEGIAREVVNKIQKLRKKVKYSQVAICYIASRNLLQEKFAITIFAFRRSICDI